MVVSLDKEAHNVAQEAALSKAEASYWTERAHYWSVAFVNESNEKGEVSSHVRWRLRYALEQIEFYKSEFCTDEEEGSTA